MTAGAEAAKLQMAQLRVAQMLRMSMVIRRLKQQKNLGKKLETA